MPEGNRFLFISPYIRTILRHEASSWGSTGASSPLYGPAGNIYDPALSSNSGDLNKRIIGELEGFQCIMTNHLPSTNIEADGSIAAPYLDQATKYLGDFRGADQATAKPAALALCGAATGAPALGMVQAAGLRSHMGPDERRNTTFMKSQILVGADILCPWTAGYVGVTS